MVSYYNNGMPYRGQQQTVPSGSGAPQQVPMGSQQQSQENPQQQHGSHWIYPHHHHQAQQHQYLEAAVPMEPAMPNMWPAHAQYLQYHQHAAYQQQQMQAAVAVNNAHMIQQASLDWNNDVANHNHNANNNLAVVNNQPSPVNTLSGSERSSPRTPPSPILNNNNNNNNNVNMPNNNSPRPQMRSSASRSPYKWIEKRPEPNPGKTRTKEKYRVVYSEHQRLELEKEFYSSKYITIRRKTELANALELSERQVKIWFQNRRAKERKQSKKRMEIEQREMENKPHMGARGLVHASSSGVPVNGMSGLSIGHMGSLMSNLMPAAPTPTGLMGHPAYPHHHAHTQITPIPPHSLLNVAVAMAAQTHHPDLAAELSELPQHPEQPDDNMGL